MKFNHWDLGQQSAGTVVKVMLTGNAANVRVMDSSNFNSFKNGGSARGVGGHYKASPAVLQIPASGHWVLVIDYGGYVGKGTAAVHVLAA